MVYFPWTSFNCLDGWLVHSPIFRAGSLRSPRNDSGISTFVTPWTIRRWWSILLWGPTAPSWRSAKPTQYVGRHNADVDSNSFTAFNYYCKIYIIYIYLYTHVYTKRKYVHTCTYIFLKKMYIRFGLFKPSRTLGILTNSTWQNMVGLTNIWIELSYYPLVNIQKTIENHYFWLVNQL